MMKRAGALRNGGLAGLRSIFIACMASLAVASMAPAAHAAAGAAIVVDAKTGKVLYANDPDGHRFPASLTKMMTLYLLFDAIESGKTNLNARIPISAHAAAQSPSKLGVKPGETISVREAILAIVTRSANDVAVAIGEYLGGSESAFAGKMTATAHAIGMTRTVFRNASGLPDPNQMTTARDMATLGRALHDRFPREFAFFSTPSFVFDGERIANHNHLLGHIDGVNGIKTGYTRASGYNLVTSVERDGRDLVAVVLGGSTGRARDLRMAGLIDDYLPKASTGPRTAPVAVAAAVAPAPAPAPAAPVVADATPAPRQRPAPAAIAAPAPIAAPTPADTGSVAVADASPAPSAADSGEGDGGDDATDQPSDNAMVPAGWKIQVAAAPSQATANSALEKALAKAPKLLASVSPYTEPVAKGGATLYRARFGGFRGKDAARNACAVLAKQSIDCIAIQ